MAEGVGTFGWTKLNVPVMNKHCRIVSLKDGQLPNAITAWMWELCAVKCLVRHSSVLDFDFDFLYTTIITLHMHIAIAPTPLKLSGRSNRRVEVFSNRQWGTVCGSGWDIQDAHVVCRQLAFSRARSYYTNATTFGQGSGHVWMSQVGCFGSETNIGNCSFTAWDSNTCSHKNDAGVSCVSSCMFVFGKIMDYSTFSLFDHSQLHRWLCAWLVDKITVKGDWRFSMEGFGVPSVMTSSMVRLQLLRVDILDTKKEPTVKHQVQGLGLELGLCGWTM